MKFSTTILTLVMMQPMASNAFTSSHPHLSTSPLCLQRNNNDYRSLDLSIFDSQPITKSSTSLQMKSSNQFQKAFASATLSAALLLSSALPTFAETAASTVQNYDGFAEYAKENQMEKSDVGCFINKCGDETKNLFSNPRGIKGVSCLGRCKGEQSCATRCFAEFGSEDLNNWLSCTIEENECVKVPKNVDNSAEKKGYTNTVEKFDPSILIGEWYKTDGLNPNYDLFDCQTNTFQVSPGVDDNSELDMGIFFRVPRPESAGGGFWENDLTEHMIVDAVKKDMPNENGRTMHTAGKMYGLSFDENWYILGQSDGKGDIPPFIVVAYKGHTLQGNYEGSFIYAKERILPSAAVPAVTEVLAKNGLDFKDFTRIDNTCSTDTLALNDEKAGTGTSTTDWIDLVVGEGGVIDWISPGWRGEYKAKK
ncbi:violaxanthin de-epoxidase-like 1 [Chaetoceros tenuissimus]|uniref:Violaxanthin de-epoxidase-like 1 n=1 Tax=Chaetoceros tenuissimus TaxID=426638 RepID=A0AAD3D3E0_9STRA|nr:violaxanthin de-epoxidase-like 1 [Chaetoceros tenuissimus]